MFLGGIFQYVFSINMMREKSFLLMLIEINKSHDWEIYWKLSLLEKNRKDKLVNSAVFLTIWFPRFHQRSFCFTWNHTYVMVLLNLSHWHDFPGSDPSLTTVVNSDSVLWLYRGRLQEWYVVMKWCPFGPQREETTRYKDLTHCSEEGIITIKS